MMKLSTMLKVDSTVDTQWRSRIAERILSYWEHDPESAQFFRSSTNFVYIFRKAGECHFLRFAESAERTAAAMIVLLTGMLQISHSPSEIFLRLVSI